VVAIVGPAVNLLAGASRQKVGVFLAYDLAGRLTDRLIAENSAFLPWASGR